MALLDGAAPGAPPADPEATLGMCAICHDPLEDGVAAACGHSFCRVCVTEYLDNLVGGCKCPSCDTPLTIDLSAPPLARKRPKAPKNGASAEALSLRIRKASILNRVDLSLFQSSTKLEALYEEIDAMLRADASAKCIVFSQFTSMLDLAQFRLQQVQSIPRFCLFVW
jgi:DNA repair protein RAD16